MNPLGSGDTSWRPRTSVAPELAIYAHPLEEALAQRGVVDRIGLPQDLGPAGLPRPRGIVMSSERGVHHRRVGPDHLHRLDPGLPGAELPQGGRDGSGGFVRTVGCHQRAGEKGAIEDQVGLIAERSPALRRVDSPQLNESRARQVSPLDAKSEKFRAAAVSPSVFANARGPGELLRGVSSDYP